MSKDYAEDLLLDTLTKLSVVSIGPFTSDELKKFKVKNTVAEVHTVAGAFDVMKNSLNLSSVIIFVSKLCFVIPWINGIIFIKLSSFVSNPNIILELSL